MVVCVMLQSSVRRNTNINFRLVNLLAIFWSTYGLVYFLYQMMGSYKQSQTLVNSGSFLEVLHQ